MLYIFRLPIQWRPLGRSRNELLGVRNTGKITNSSNSTRTRKDRPRVGVSIANSDDANPRTAVEQVLLDDEPNIRPKPGDGENLGGEQLSWNTTETSINGHLSLPDPDGQNNSRGTTYTVSYLVCDQAQDVLLHLGMSHDADYSLTAKRL